MMNCIFKYSNVYKTKNQKNRDFIDFQRVTFFIPKTGLSHALLFKFVVISRGRAEYDNITPTILGENLIYGFCGQAF